MTWFTAWLALDEKRVEARRDGLLPCLELSQDYSPSACSTYVPQSGFLIIPLQEGLLFLHNGALQEVTILPCLQVRVYSRLDMV